MTGLIVHEWFSRHGGSENVAVAMASVFPDSDVLCLWNDAPERFVDRTVAESWLARTPLRRYKVAALPFMPATWAAVDVSRYDYVLVSSHLFAHHVGGPVREGSPRKFVYAHTPARYIWTPELDNRGASLPARLVSPVLRRLDAARARGGAVFAANSEYVRDRIRRAWDQDAEVIYPPVQVERIQHVGDWRDLLSAGEEEVLAALPSPFLLGASRFVPYKRLDVVIRTGEAVGLPVVLAGSGPGRPQLEGLANSASVPIMFVDQPSDALLYSLYQAALALVFPAVEDFGIMPVEAMSLGTPVIVSAEGGAKESVNALSGGIIVDSFSGSQMRRALGSVADLDMQRAQERAARLFGATTFSHRLREWVR